ncbi:protein PROCA1 [Protopterus annectens]|uniref:protein PROCA1 n=1 Tax=Protopterus annectens TaxID=7888 RepID=UPI001CFA519B|nr:protein PROCA1 [Protopterus annectens]
MWSLVLVLLTYMDPPLGAAGKLSETQGDEGMDRITYHLVDGTICVKESRMHATSGPIYWYQVTDGLVIVSTSHDNEGQVVGCNIQDDPRAVKAFTEVCRLELRSLGHTSQSNTGNRLPANFSSVAEVTAACHSFLRAEPFARTGTQKQLHRSKRGFTYPGTLWCGAGNNAESYDHLGEFVETDKCCRTHDACPHVIYPFSYAYGYRNLRWHTISHCDCDRVMQECLRKVNDTASRVVGQAFFNVIRVPCFELDMEERCIEHYWYGWCKTYKNVAVAKHHDPILFDFGGELIDAKLTLPPDEESTTTLTTATSSKHGTKTPPIPKGQPTLNEFISVAEDLLKVMATVSQSSTVSTTDVSRTTVFNKVLKKKKQKNKKGRKKGKGLKKKNRLNSKRNKENIKTKSDKDTNEQVKVVISEMNKSSAESALLHVLEDELDMDLDLGGKENPFNDIMNDEPVRDESGSVTTLIRATEHVLKEQPTILPMISASQQGTSKKQKKHSREKKRRRKKPQPTNVQDLEMF